MTTGPLRTWYVFACSAALIAAALLLLAGCGQKTVPGHAQPQEPESPAGGEPLGPKGPGDSREPSVTTTSEKARKAAPGGSPAVEQWGQWRGPLGSGVAPHATPPVAWSEEKNIRWKIALPGRGHSTPVVWGERVFVTAAVSRGPLVAPATHRPGEHDNLARVRRQEFVVLAVSRRDGKILWQKTVAEEVPHEGGHVSGSFASHSPATDGKVLIAYFGSRGLFGLDVSGELKWKTDLGEMQTKHGHGEGSSLALHGDTVVVNWDHEGRSFAAAYDTGTGKRRWKAERDETTSWSTPIVVEHDGRAQVIVSAAKRVRAYDLTTGEMIWECGGLSQNVVASPVAADGMVYAGSSYGIRAMLAIRLDGAKGNITGGDRVAWKLDQYTPYVPSPLLYEGKLYFHGHYQPVWTCLTAKTGETVYGPIRLRAIHNVYGSPVGAAGRVYITDLDGTTLVLRHGEKPDVLAVNRLDESFSASAALAGGDLFLRGAKHLYCIAAKPAKEE